MKVEEIHGGKYRVRKTVNGKVYRVVFDHEPTQKEIAIAVGEALDDENIVESGAFEHYAREYIENRRNVISPSTIRTYLIKLKQLSEDFKKININVITNEDVQAEVNKLAVKLEPKTVKTTYGFISSVLSSYRPKLVLRIKLPQAIKKAVYEPNNEDIKRILDKARETRYSVAFQLGVLSCRRGEICALTIEDLNGNNLKIHRNMIHNENNEWEIKETPKTDESNRIIPLPQSLADEIRAQGFIYDGHPNALNKAIHRFQKELGIPQFKFHTLRSYFASHAHSMGIPDVDIMAIGGWKTDSVMKRVYRKSIEESKKESLAKLANGLFG